jgi:hypothetical protein
MKAARLVQRSAPCEIARPQQDPRHTQSLALTAPKTHSVASSNPSAHYCPPNPSLAPTGDLQANPPKSPSRADQTASGGTPGRT